MSNNSFVHRRSRDPMEIPGLLPVLQSPDHGLRRSVRSQSQRRLPRLCIEGGSQ